MPTRHRLRTVEAAMALAVMRIVIVILPFAMLSRFAGGVAAPAGSSHAQPTTDPVALAVARALQSASARLPWHSTCLVQALAGRLMLRLRHRPATVVLGVAHVEGEFRAHAWLLSSGGTVCGGREADAYTTIAVLRGHA